MYILPNVIDLVKDQQSGMFFFRNYLSVEKYLIIRYCLSAWRNEIMTIHDRDLDD